VLDLNGMQVEGATDRVLRMGKIAEKWEAFGWAVEAIDGHEIPQILKALEWARATKGRPSVIVAKTVPGRGASSLEGRFSHYAKLPAAAAAAALSELESAQ